MHPRKRLLHQFVIRCSWIVVTFVLFAQIGCLQWGSSRVMPTHVTGLLQILLVLAIVALVVYRMAEVIRSGYPRTCLNQRPKVHDKEGKLDFKSYVRGRDD